MLCSSGRPEAPYVDQNSLELTDIHRGVCLQSDGTKRHGPPHLPSLLNHDFLPSSTPLPWHALKVTASLHCYFSRSNSNKNVLLYGLTKKSNWSYLIHEIMLLLGNLSCQIRSPGVGCHSLTWKSPGNPPKHDSHCYHSWSPSRI